MEINYMKANRFSRITVTTLTIVMTFLFCVSGTSVMAQTTGKSSAKLERERMSKIMNPGADVEEFRQEYLNYLTEFEDTMRLFSEIKVVREKLNKNGSKWAETIVQAKLSIANATPEDLRLLRDVYAKFPGWRDAPQSLNALIKPELRQSLERRIKNKKDGTIELDITPDNCADGINAGITNTDIAIADAFRIAAEALQDVIPPPFNFVAVAATAATKGVVLAFQTLKNIKDDCEGNAFQTDITTQLTNSVANDNTNTTNIINNAATNTTTITTAVSNAQTAIVNNNNANTTMIVNNDNANTTAIINNANANKDEMKNLLLRTQIEADLASTDGSVFVALYETPVTKCFPSLNSLGLPQTGLPANTVQCGLLDLVRSIVQQTIANVNTSSNAANFFAQGDAQRAAGNYKAAYASYRKAYKAASN